MDKKDLISNFRKALKQYRKNAKRTDDISIVFTTREFDSLLETYIEVCDRKTNEKNTEKVMVMRKDFNKVFSKENIFIGSQNDYKNYIANMGEVKCVTCKELKSTTEFDKDSSKLAGRKSVCKKCLLARRRSPTGVIKTIFSRQQTTSKRRGHSMPKYTIDELIVWVNNQSRFMNIHKEWVLSGYLSTLSPSIDRLDITKGYSFDNIELVTWDENLKRETFRQSKPIVSFNMKNDEIRSYDSIRAASRELGINKGRIQRYINTSTLINDCLFKSK